jgi:DNA-binding MarR family transcriptional regulator
VERPLPYSIEEGELSNDSAAAALARLERITQRLRREIHLLLRAHSMTVTQYNVLRTLYSEARGGLTCSELASRLAGTDPDITRLLDRLAKQRLVQRRRDASDRRAVVTEITDQGRQLIESVTRPLDERIRGLFEHMPKARLQLLIDLLDEAMPARKHHDRAPQLLPTACAGLSAETERRKP